MIGYDFSKQMTTNIIVPTLKNAYFSQRHKDKVILHIDLESKYTSQEFKDLTLDFNKIQSFSDKGCSYDTACIESYPANLKKKCIKQPMLPLRKLESPYFNT